MADKAVDYTAVRDGLKTGDVVLFSGKGPVSGVIRLFTGGPWSHVGLVVRAACGGGLGDAVMLWESTTLTDVPDATGRPAIKGVQLVTLSQRLAAYDGTVAIRALRRPLDASQTSKLARLRKTLSRRPYEASELELLRSAIDGFGRSNREDLSTVFCSELVAEAFQAVGLLPEPPHGPPSNEYTPMDFSQARSLRLPWRIDTPLGPEVEIDPVGPRRITLRSDADRKQGNRSTRC